MAEYIKKSDALCALEYCATWNRGLVTAFDEIQAIPAADVAPVVHGEWINKTIPYRADVEQRVDCSACKHIFFHTSALTYNYCPNCGAKMDGERRSE